MGKVWFRRVSQLLVLLLVFTYAFILLPIGIEQADAETVIAHLGAGETPSAASVNPATNKIYVTNRTSNNVTVIDGATNNITSAVYAGNSPGAVAVNPATNMIYVTNFISNDVTVIDGTTDTVASTVYAGNGPCAVAVNPNTNRVYVTNTFSDTITVIDGSNNITTVNAGAAPRAVAVNQTTNKIYAANSGSNNVTVIDGVNDAVTATIGAGGLPCALAVNTATNKIYVANMGSDTVTVIDGATDTVTGTVAVGDEPQAITVNPATNKIYVVNQASDTVTVIDGANDTVTASVAVGDLPSSIAVNIATNKIYVVSYNDNNIIVHLSCYAVAYVTASFKDLDGVEWGRKPIEVMASKGIINGTGQNAFSPSAYISRADYLVLLIKTLGLTAGFEGNFDDVQPGIYYYQAIGIAKKLGIATGSGNNRYNPRDNISRQDMMVLTARALERFKGLKVTGDTADLDKFSDKGDIAGYAVRDLATLVREGLIAGSNDKLNPRLQTTRAEAAVFLYQIYNKF